MVIINCVSAFLLSFFKLLAAEKIVLIFDFGGGTLDVSILSIRNSVFEVKSTAGNTHLGGEDLDNRLVNYFVEEFKRKQKKDLTQSKRALRRLRSACERAKRHLSSFKQATIEVDSLFDGIDFHSSITRARFEDLNIDLFQNALEPLTGALTDSAFNKAQIDEVVLVGGSTRIPKVQQLLQDFFDGKPLNKSINPDEAVAYGAAIQAAVISGDKSDEIKDLVLMDLTPLSLGLEYEHGRMGVIIERCTPIPAKVTRKCTTLNDYQNNVLINVYEGERELTRDNYLLGSFRLTGIPRARRYVPEINITFDLDLNGILNVTAVERSTGRSNSITITYDKNRLSQEEVDRLIADVERYRAENERLKQTRTARDALEYFCLKMRREIEEEQKFAISETDKKRIFDCCSDAIQWLEFHVAATREDIILKQNEVEELCNSIIRKP